MIQTQKPRQKPAEGFFHQSRIVLNLPQVIRYWDKNKRVNNGINPLFVTFYWLKMLLVLLQNFYVALPTGNSSPGEELRQGWVETTNIRNMGFSGVDSV